MQIKTNIFISWKISLLCVTHASVIPMQFQSRRVWASVRVFVYVCFSPWTRDSSPFRMAINRSFYTFYISQFDVNYLTEVCLVFQFQMCQCCYVYWSWEIFRQFHVIKKSTTLFVHIKASCRLHTLLHNRNFIQFHRKSIIWMLRSISRFTHEKKATPPPPPRASIHISISVYFAIVLVYFKLEPILYYNYFVDSISNL